LILVCPNCYFKITKGGIKRWGMGAIKKILPDNRQKNEFASVMSDSKNYSWISYNNVPNAFKDIKNKKSPFPILTFIFYPGR
jgi:hypothetical protein